MSPSVGRAYRLALTVLAAMMLMGSLWTIPDVAQVLIQAMLYHEHASHPRSVEAMRAGLVAASVVVVLTFLLTAWLLHKMHGRRRWAVIAWTVMQVLSALSLPDYVARVGGSSAWTWGGLITLATGTVSCLVTLALWHPRLRPHWWSLPSRDL